MRIFPSCSSNADVFVEAHISEDLTVNQCWDVRSDVTVFFCIFCFEEELDLFWMIDCF